MCAHIGLPCVLLCRVILWTEFVCGGSTLRTSEPDAGVWPQGVWLTPHPHILPLTAEVSLSLCVDDESQQLYVSACDVK